MAAGVRSSSRTWSSLRSISSRRRRISKRLLSEVKNSPKNEAPAGGGRGVPWAGAFELAEQINLGPCSAAVGEVCLFFCFTHIALRAKRPLGRFDHVWRLVYL